MGGLLQLGEDHVESLHQGNFFSFEGLKFIAKRCLRIRNLTINAEIVGGGTLASGQSGVDGIAL